MVSTEIEAWLATLPVRKLKGDAPEALARRKARWRGAEWVMPSRERVVIDLRTRHLTLLTWALGGRAAIRKLDALASAPCP